MGAEVNISNSVTPTSTGIKFMLKIDILGLNSPSFPKVQEADSTPHPECGDCRSIFLPSESWIENL